MARLIYFRNEESSEEGVVIETDDKKDNKKLAEEYGMPVQEIVDLDSPCSDWPVDRLLLPE
jgi:hypothetical protein